MLCLCKMIPFGYMFMQNNTRWVYFVNNLQLLLIMKDPIIKHLIEHEKQRQIEGLELIASENFVSTDVLQAMGSVLTNKYAEGLPQKRYYGGCDVVDEVENLAIDRAKKIFNAEWANVQPHSGSQANAAAMMAVVKPGDTIMGFDLAHGGHLTHGSKVSFSGQIYKATSYGLDPKKETLDMDAIESIALNHRPKLIICGGSAYSREWDFKRFRDIADSIGAYLMGDIAHIAGLEARNIMGLLKAPDFDKTVSHNEGDYGPNSALKYCHFVTTTTHKTLRGPRGGMILVGKDFENLNGIKTKKGRIKMLSELLDSAVFPGTQGGPLMHVIAAKAVSFNENLQPGFLKYIDQVKLNAKKLVQEFQERNYRIVSGDTDNHLLLIDLTDKNITGNIAEKSLEKAGISINKNLIPFDTKSPFVTSGIRIGTPAITTRGLKGDDMLRIVDLIDRVLNNYDDENFLKDIKLEIKLWMKEYPIFAE